MQVHSIPNITATAITNTAIPNIATTAIPNTAIPTTTTQVVRSKGTHYNLYIY